jgi:hypothetical protein
MFKRVKSVWLVAMSMAVAGGRGSACASADDIAVSLVNSASRLDAPSG